MFGNFQNTWSSGFTQFSDLSDKVQKLKTGIEAGLQDSGLLGPGEVPLGQDTALAGPSSTPQKDLHPGDVAQDRNSNHHLSPAGAPSEIEEDVGEGSGARQGEGDASKGNTHDQSGWDEEELELEVPTEPERRAETAEFQSADGRTPQTLENAADSSTSPVDETQAAPESTDLGHQHRASASSPASHLPEEFHEPAQLEPNDLAVQPEIRGEEVDISKLPQPADDRDSSAQPSSEGTSKEGEPVPDASVDERGDLFAEADPQQELHIDPQKLEENPSVKYITSPDADAMTAAPAEVTSAPAGWPTAPEIQEDSIQEMSLADLLALALQMRDTLKTREVQLERKSEEVANMQEVTHRLMERNEELARKSAKASEEDIKTLTDEYEVRLGASERKVYALTKERDMLKRGQEKLTSANDLIKEKDSIIAQVMAEGELLSKKQLAQESTMKKLRQHVKDAELSRQELAANLTLERQRLEQMQTAKQKLEADLAAAKHAHRVEVETERAHYEGLLAKSRSAQVEAENKVAAAAKEGLSKRLKDAEMRADMLVEQLSDLQASLERHRAAADSREEMLKKELAAMERRNQEAEARHEELTGKLPDTTRPLLRQIEGMQRTAAAHAQAWQAAEQSLQQRLSEAESQAANAGEKERIAIDKLQAAVRRANSVSAAMDALREECSDLLARCSNYEVELESSQQLCRRLEDQIFKLQGKVADLEKEKAELEAEMQQALANERRDSSIALESAEQKILRLEERVRKGAISSPSKTPNGLAPPAMAGPGFKWVLQKESEAAGSPQEGHQEPSNSMALKFNDMSRITAPELGRLKDALHQKEEQLASYQQTISQLEITRDSLAEELVSTSQTAEQQALAYSQFESLQRDYMQVQQKLNACTELLGEREERILELTADVSDMKALYREQIEFVLGELKQSCSPSAAASSVSSWNPGPES